jgi:hypothetical protein
LTNNLEKGMLALEVRCLNEPTSTITALMQKITTQELALNRRMGSIEDGQRQVEEGMCAARDRCAQCPIGLKALRIAEDTAASLETANISAAAGAAQLNGALSALTIAADTQSGAMRVLQGDLRYALAALQPNSPNPADLALALARDIAQTADVTANRLQTQLTKLNDAVVRHDLTLAALEETERQSQARSQGNIAQGQGGDSLPNPPPPSPTSSDH